jgi:hypothetical protein
VVTSCSSTPGDGRAFSTFVVPGTAGAGADDVLPIDHDADGASEFLVLNGRGVAGPVQLISIRPVSPS